MKNLFESYEEGEPLELSVGDRWAWTRSDVSETYPTSDYTMGYAFSSRGDSKKNFSITASKVNGHHIITEPAEDTKGYAPGDYLWRLILVRDSDAESVTVAEGLTELVRIKGDVSSHAYKVLSAIRAVIEGKATKDQISYSINGRSLTRYSFEDLMKLEKEYTRRVNREAQDIKRKSGRPGKHRVLTKLGA